MGDGHDAIFHLLYHGIIKTFIGMIREATKEAGFASLFEFFSHEMLDSIHALQMSEFLALRFRKGDKKVSGWIGSNFYGFLCVCPFLLSRMRLVEQTRMLC